MSGVEPAFLMAIGAVAGAIFGSFLGTIVSRWPRGRSALAGRSRCDHCDAPLGAADMVPILSFAALRGRCRHCRKRIDPSLPGIEAGAALVGLVAIAAHPFPLALVSLGFGLWLLLLAILDLRHHWLPDLLTLPLVPLGLLTAWAGLGPPLLDRAIGAAGAWLILVSIDWAYRLVRGRKGMGGGDPKLLAGIGAFVGFLQLPFVLIGTGLLGLAAALAMRLRGEPVDATTRLPLGTLAALVAWPIWLVAAAPQGVNP